MANFRNPKQNHFLAKLNINLYDKILPHLELITLSRDLDIYPVSGKIDFIYFPISSIIAVVKVLMDGASPEVATIGNDGLVGSDIFMGAHSPTNKVIVQSAGFAYRIKAAFVKNIFEVEPEFRDLILRYIHSVHTQSAQIAACNRYHNVEQQVCRFLLTSLDRWSSNRISLTHQRVADLLGVRRAGVSEVSAHLAKNGYIKYHRGCVTILNREALQNHVCECYQIIKAEVDSILK